MAQSRIALSLTKYETLIRFQIVRQIKFKRLRRSVAQQLFLGMETFSQPLIELHVKLHKILEMSFCTVAQQHTYLLKEFKEKHERAKHKADINLPHMFLISHILMEVRLVKCMVLI